MATGAAAEQAAQREQQDQPNKDVDKGPGSVSGNLTKDPDLRYTNSGRPVTSLRIASSERVRNAQTGAWEDAPTVYYDIQAWGNLAENIVNSLERGDRIVAEGRWHETKWEDKEGVERERVYLSARDLGPSMIFRAARPERKGKS